MAKIKNLLKTKTPVIIGVTLALIILIVLFITLDFKNKKTEPGITLYQQEFPDIFSEIKDDYSKDQVIPQLTKIADHYQAQNSRFAAQIPAETYQKPLVFEKQGYKLDIAPKDVKGEKIKSAAYKEQDVNYLIYKNAYQSTDIIKKIQPDGIKEFIILRSEKAPKQFDFILNVSEQMEVRQENDGAIRFYKNEKTNQQEQKPNIRGMPQKGPDNFLYRIPAPYIIDINYQKSTDSEWQLNKISNTQYNLILVYNPANLKYPIAIDPSITDTYDDETKIAAKTNTEIVSSQAKLSAQTWYNVSWLYRKQITINSTVVSESDAGIANFPVMINIASDSDLSADALSNGYDILFTSSNGSTKLDHEIEKYDSEGDLIAWVGASSLSSTSDTILYMYYGNGSAANQQNASAAWDANFVMVQHMDDDATASIQDSTSNSRDGAKVGANEPIEISDGQIGRAQSFDGSNDYVSLAALTMSVNSETISLWVYSNTIFTDNYGDSGHIIGAVDQYKQYLGLVGSSTSTYRLIGETGLNNEYFVNTASASYAVPKAQWNCISVTFDNGTVTSYVNGGQKAVDTGNTTDWLFSRIGLTNALTIFTGFVDEIRISNSARSLYWLNNEYNNMASSSAFYTVGSEQGFYNSSGTLTSTNLLSGQGSVTSIDSFYYNAFSLPSGTELEVQFSPDNTNWYSASGSADWTTADVTSGETISLSSLGWSGAIFYYKFQLYSNTAQTATPLIDDIQLNYTGVSAGEVRFKGGTRLKGGIRIK